MNKELPTKVQLVLGLILLAIGIFPWIYTPLLQSLLTGMPVPPPSGGDEGSGMLGTMIFLFIGMPGVSLTFRAVSRLRKDKS